MTRIESDPVSAPHTTVLVAPAMGVPARVYRRLTEALTTSGFDVEIVPRRGIEEGSEPPSRRSDWSYADEAADLADAVAAARADDTETRVLVVGHSLGAQLAAMVAVPEEHAPDGIVAIGASVPHFRHYGLRGVPLAALAASVAPVAGIAGRWPRGGFGGPTPRTLMREWARMVLTGRAPFALDSRIGAGVVDPAARRRARHRPCGLGVRRRVRTGGDHSLALRRRALSAGREHHPHRLGPHARHRRAPNRGLVGLAHDHHAGAHRVRCRPTVMIRAPRPPTWTRSVPGCGLRCHEPTHRSRRRRERGLRHRTEP